MCTDRCSGRRGGCLPGGGQGVSAPVHAGIHPPPLWIEFLTHAYENITYITFPQLRCGR